MYLIFMQNLKSFNILLLIIITFSESKLLAGSADAELTCISDSKRTQLSGTVPHDESGFNLTLTVDKDKVVFSNEVTTSKPTLKEGEYFTYQEFEDKVYVLNVFAIDSIEVHGEPRSLRMQFHAIPKTVKKKSGLNSYQVKFKAVLKNWTDPRKKKNPENPNIKLNCIFDYSI